MITINGQRYSETKCSVHGVIFQAESKITTDDIWNQVKLQYNNNNIAHYTSSLDGHYNIICVYDDITICMVDRIRSYPICLTKSNNDVIIESTSQHIATEDDNSIEINSAIEMLYAGYVSNCNTFKNNTISLKASQIAIVNNITQDIKIVNVTKYEQKSKSYESFDNLEDKYDSVFTGCIDKLLKVANGRQIVIPLSGGYDSRLCAIALKAKGAEIASFTYGKTNNSEAVVSKDVAEKLNIPWYFVEYTPAIWKEMFKSEDYQKYEQYAAGLTSLPHLQDYIAIRELKKRNIVKKDAMFVPGHSGDFNAGSHLKPIIYQKLLNHEMLHDIIMYQHHYLNTDSIVSDCVSLSRSDCKQILTMRIRESLENTEYNSIEQGIEILDEWNMNERQSKYIINSVRTYEWFGYKWYLPFWSVDNVKYWQDIKVSLKYKKYLYDKYVDKKQKIYQMQPINKIYKDSVNQYIIRKCGQKSNIIKLLRFIKNTVRKYSEYNEQTIIHYQAYDKTQYYKLWHERFINSSIYTYQYITKKNIIKM